MKFNGIVNLSIIPVCQSQKDLEKFKIDKNDEMKNE
jgi:hypothetical protein